MKLFYEPSDEALNILNTRTWVASYSGGKDSTSVVTWIEWLRRKGLVTHPQPRLVLSDTEVEYPFLQEITHAVISLFRSLGWHCEVVRPRTKDKLYCQIFGRGMTPVSPVERRMRWCTRSTKVDPMSRWAKTLGDDVMQLTGVRWGESKIRDAKLKANELKVLSSCHAGGECGLPIPKSQDDRKLFAPIIDWKTCQVLDWLDGAVGREVQNLLSPDVYPLTRRLIHAYGIKQKPPGMGMAPPEMTSLRFGCTGCPAVEKSKVLDEYRDSHLAPLRKIYTLWVRARLPKNRCVRDLKPGESRRNTKAARRVGPLKMAARKKLYEEFLTIQKEAGVVLVTPEDDAFIRKCWDDEVYPKGWSKDDEA